MASRKERRKLTKQKLRRGQPLLPKVQRDGDRRRRGGISVDEALRLKEQLRLKLGQVDLT